MMNKTVKKISVSVFKILALPAVLYWLLISIAPPVNVMFPPLSEYRGGVAFSAALGRTQYDPVMYYLKAPVKFYDFAKWDRSPADVKCPITVSYQEDVWGPEAFELTSFLKSGAVDSRIEAQKMTGVTYDPNRPFWAVFRSQDGVLIISCRYQPDSSLEQVQVIVNPEKLSVLPPNQGVRGPGISMGERSVILPASHKELISGLGQPEKYYPARFGKRSYSVVPLR